MSRKTVGMLGMILGGLFFSLELYLLKFLQTFERISGSWYEDVGEYMRLFPCNWALVITVFIIIVSGVITFYQKK
ncbi:hypothetical protein [Anaerotignum sp.]